MMILNRKLYLWCESQYMYLEKVKTATTVLDKWGRAYWVVVLEGC